jgi:adenylyltransferase/sulfurtransferase
MTGAPSPDIDPRTSRYARQAVLDVIGRAGQRKLFEAAILIVGCGALGSVQAELLTRAGVGRILLADRDVLELHNLQRQTLFDERDVRERMPKAVAAARRLRAVNSEIAVEPVVTDVTAANIEELFGPADLVLDGTDNIETRYLMNDASAKTGTPWVYGGVLGTSGTVMAVHPGRGPCLRCIFPDPPEPGEMPTCETQGVLNTAVAWVAALQATEAIRILSGGPVDGFTLHTLDVWRGAATPVRVERDEDCVCCGRRSFEFLESERGSSVTSFCGRNAVQVTPERKIVPDFSLLRERLSPIGSVTLNGLVLEFETNGDRLIVFPDGRVLVMGTTDTARARTLVARYIGS